VAAAPVVADPVAPVVEEVAPVADEANPVADEVDPVQGRAGAAIRSLSTHSPAWIIQIAPCAVDCCKSHNTDKGTLSCYGRLLKKTSIGTTSALSFRSCENRLPKQFDSIAESSLAPKISSAPQPMQTFPKPHRKQTPARANRPIAQVP
jgi:hypothetical protein